MKKKYRWFLLMAVSLLVLAGWGKKSVELLSDKKLIDLSAALGNCILGAEDLLPEEDKTHNQDVPSATPGPTIRPTQSPTITPKLTAAPTTAPKPTLPLKTGVLDISVRDQVVTYNYVPWSDLGILKEQLRRDHSTQVSFRLLDNYAEAHVYRQVADMLEELKKEIGLSYTRD